MYEVHTTITLRNGKDVMKAEMGLIKEAEVRQVTLDAVVDTGAWCLVINEETRAKLGVEVTGTDTVNLADGGRTECSTVGLIETWWKDRHYTHDALMLPDSKEVLLGAIPLEAMDLIVDPRQGTLIGAHGDQIVHRLY
ncbi:MAG: aspartyl protease family protein [Treponema sp.]|jgi:clan AA aspartic protease|nr:aspartyl protease family protein [Treponema sp.]